MQNCASLAAGRSRSAKEAAAMSPGDWAGNHAPQSAVFCCCLLLTGGTACFVYMPVIMISSWFSCSLPYGDHFTCYAQRPLEFLKMSQDVTNLHKNIKIFILT